MKAPLTTLNMAAAATEKKGGIDVQLLIYFALWYLGNYYYNITNKLALNVRGGGRGLLSLPDDAFTFP